MKVKRGKDHAGGWIEREGDCLDNTDQRSTASGVESSPPSLDKRGEKSGAVVLRPMPANSPTLQVVGGVDQHGLGGKKNHEWISLERHMMTGM